MQEHPTQPSLFNQPADQPLKQCSKCKCHFPHTAFHTITKTNYSYKQSWCKPCVSASCRAYHKTPAGKKSSRRRKLRRAFGIELEAYDAMLANQGGVCAICGRKETKRSIGDKNEAQPLAVDHDERTGLVRAILCDVCNKGLGMFRENPALLRKAAAYLESFGK